MAIIEGELKNMAFNMLKHRPITTSEYRLMDQAGIFKPEERVELIDGDIVTMSPIGPSHNRVVYELSQVLRSISTNDYAVLTQSSLELGNNNQPQPDIMVVDELGDEYWTRNPMATDVKLVVEVSESTLEYDRKVKCFLYASAGIKEYWIVNLIDRLLEVYREPLGAIYQNTSIYSIDQAIEPLYAQGKLIPISSFLKKS